MDPVAGNRVREAIEVLLRAFPGLVSTRGDFSALAPSGPSAAAVPRDGSVVFLQKAVGAEALRLATLRHCLLILPPEAEEAGDEAAARGNGVVLAWNPKYAYAFLAAALFPVREWRGALTREIGPYALAAEDAVIEEGAVIEPFVTIGRGARIGAGSIVMRGASIGPAVRIGRDCVIKENAVVGDLGFGFAFDGEREALRLPQLGGVSVGDRVEIGALTTVGAGTMAPTVIEDEAKLSDHVHIAHNCRIGRGSIIACHASVSGSSAVGERCWLAPAATVRNKLRVGAGATIGMGAVVTADVAEGSTVAGVPARPLARDTPWYLSERGTP